MKTSTITTIALLYLAVAHGYVVEERAFCPEDYSPCKCVLTTNGLEVSCIDVSTDQIQNVFYRTRARDIYSVVLSATASTTLQETVVIPADLMSDKRAANFFINCPAPSAGSTVEKYGLQIDSNAFRFTRDYTTHFEINNCNLASSVGFAFLLNFAILKELIVVNSINVNLLGLPSLSALSDLTLTDSTGIEENSASFPILTPARLTKFSANGCKLTDAGASSILSKIGSSTSASSLVHLDFSRNALTKVPAEIHSMAKLSSLNLMQNEIPLTQVGDLSFVAPVTSVFLDMNNMDSMAQGTFEYGDFTRAAVSIKYNKLTEFSKGVFLPILEQMRVQPPITAGYIDVTDNPFSCRCSLAWLIRDNPDLIPYIRNGVCEGFFKFEDLSPNSYADCPP